MGIDNVVRKGKVDIIDTMTFLVIPDSTRDDSGKYCLTLQSPAGEKAVFVNVKVLGKFQVSFDTACKFYLVTVKKHKVFACITMPPLVLK